MTKVEELVVLGAHRRKSEYYHQSQGDVGRDGCIKMPIKEHVENDRFTVRILICDELYKEQRRMSCTQQPN